MTHTIAPFVTDPVLTGITVGYRNKSYIADAVLPRAQVGAYEFAYVTYPDNTNFDRHDTRVGRKSAPNRVSGEANRVTGLAEDYGLEDVVPLRDVVAAEQAGIPDPRHLAAERITEWLLVDREARAAGVVFNAASYRSGLKQTLAGNDQWSDFSASDPIGDIMGALDLPLVRPNIGVFGQPAWTKFRQHPAIVEAVLGTAASKGVVSREKVAELFELDEIVVGQARYNSSKPGQAMNLTGMWGKHFALIHRAPVVTGQGEVTFGATFQVGGRMAGSWEDKNGGGLRGGHVVRVGEALAEKVIADAAGYFFQNVIA